MLSLIRCGRSLSLCYALSLSDPGGGADREAFELRTPLVLYNFFLVGLNAYIAWELVYNHYWVEGNNLICSEVDKRPDGPPIRVRGDAGFGPLPGRREFVFSR